MNWLRNTLVKISSKTIWLSLLGIGMLSAAVTFFWLDLSQPTTTTQTSTNTPLPTPSPTPDPLAPFSVALLGYGGGGHDGGALTDSIMVAKIIPRLQQILLISIPRDLWVTLPETQTQTKINAAYVTGLDERSWPYSVRPTIFQSKTAGGELAKQTLSQVVGFPVQHYVAISFAGFTSAINSLGGITVKVPMSFTDNFYPIAGQELATCDKSEEEIKALSATLSGFQLEQQFACRYEKLALTAGIQTLDASTSLKFVRSRHSEVQGNDFNRSLRQQAFIQGVKQKLLSPSVWPKLPNLAKQLLKNVDTDLNLGILSGWLTTFPNPDQYQLYNYSLTPETGLVASRSADRQFILVPAQNLGWEGIQQQLAAWEAATATKSSQFDQSAVQSSP